jgi:hypothetical protein
MKLCNPFVEFMENCVDCFFATPNLPHDCIYPWKKEDWENYVWFGSMCQQVNLTPMAYVCLCEGSFTIPIYRVIG